MKRALPLFVFLGIVAAVLSGQEKLAGGPYAVNVSQKSATVVWIVNEGELSLSSAAGGAAKISPVLRAQSASFTGLQPGVT
jgi:hypothetical protein